jgi:hypothetical protein
MGWAMVLLLAGFAGMYLTCLGSCCCSEMTDEQTPSCLGGIQGRVRSCRRYFFHLPKQLKRAERLLAQGATDEADG